MITQKELQKLLLYDPETGFFYWRNSPKHCAGRIKTGARAGYRHHKNHWEIEIHRKSYILHRLAWLYVYGVWPSSMLDHKDRNRGNNAIKNLRIATNGQNRANSRANKNTATGFKGVTLCNGSKKNPYHAQITVRGKCQHIGLFPTAEKAHKAYCEKAKAYFKKFHHGG